jgi:hypothetical protein
MENHINLSPASNLYLQHFYVALTNFEKWAHEERERKQRKIAQELKRKMK